MDNLEYDPNRSSRTANTQLNSSQPAEPQQTFSGSAYDSSLEDGSPTVVGGGSGYGGGIGSGFGKKSLSPLTYNRKAMAITGAALAMIFLIGVAAFGLNSYYAKKAANKITAESFKVGKLDTTKIVETTTKTISESERLDVNGQLQVGNTIVLTPTQAPQKSTATPGQMYYDKNTNQLYYYNGTTFVSVAQQNGVISLGGASGVLGIGEGLAMTNNQLSVASSLLQAVSAANNQTKVTSIQGLTGAVSLVAGTGISINGPNISNIGVTSLSGTIGQVVVSSSTGGVTISLPQNIDTAATPTFAGLTLNGSQTINNGGSLIFFDSGSSPFTTTLSAISQPGQNQIITLPASSAPTDIVCLQNLSNCNPGSSGLTAPSGNQNYLTKFTNLAASQVGNSMLYDNGVSVGVGTSSPSASYLVDVNGAVRASGNLTATGTVTFSNLAIAGVVHTNGSGVLSTGAVQLSTETSGNYVATLGALTGLTSTGNSGNGSTPTLSVNYGSAANTAVQGNTSITCPLGTGNLTGGGNSFALGSAGSCNSLTVVNSPTFSGTLSVTGPGGIVVGGSGVAGVVKLANSGNANLGSLITANIGQNSTYTLPDPGPGASDTICLLTLGNCSGSGNGVTGTGTSNKIAKFTGLHTVADSSITDDGTDVTIGANLIAGAIQATSLQSAGVLNITSNGSLNIGTNNQVLALQGSATSTLTINSNGFTNVIGFIPLTANRTINFPNETGTVCLQNSANCGFAAGGSGVTALIGTAGGSVNALGLVTINNALSTGSAITINDAAYASKGIASFSSTNFTVAAGAVTTIQNINTTAAVTFGSLTLGSGDLTLATGNKVITDNVNTTVGSTGLVLDAGANGITFKTHSATNDSFVFPTGGGPGQTICTSGITCVAGGGTAVTLEPGGGVQNANANLTTIFVNKQSGTGNLIQLQAGGADAFVISNTGNTTLNNTVTVSSTLQVNTITPTAALTVGSTAQTFTLQGNGSSLISATGGGAVTSLGFAIGSGGTAPQGNVTYQLQNDNTVAAGTYTICTTAGNCAGVGGSITGSGTSGKLAKFTAAGAIGDSILTETTNLITVNGNLAVGTATNAQLSVGVANSGSASGTIVLNNASNTNTVTLNLATTPTANRTISLPNASGTVAVSASGPLVLDANTGALTCPTCLASGGGGAGGVTDITGTTGGSTPVNSNVTINNALTSGSTITIDDASTTVKGIASFNSTNFTASGGAINTIQDIATGSTPTFTGLIVQGSGGATLGSSTNLGQLVYKDGTVSGFTNILKTATLGGNRIITLPDASGTVAVSVVGSNLSLSAQGALSFSASPTFATSVTTPSLLGSGGSLNIGSTATTVTLQGNGSLQIKSTDSGNTASVGFVTPTATRTINFPNESGTVCLQNSVNCGFAAGGGGGVSALIGTAGGSVNASGTVTFNNALTTASAITINDAKADASTKGIASFNGTNFSDSLGVINTAQNINTGASPSFAGLTLSGFGAGIVQSSAGGVLSSGTLDRNSSNLINQLNVSNGGTGVGTLTLNGILYGNGTSAIQATSAAANSILATNGTNVPGLTQTLPTAVQGNITSTGALASGSIASGFGVISTASNIATTANLQGGTIYGGASNQFQVDSAGNTQTSGTLTVTNSNGITIGVANTAANGKLILASTGTGSVTLFSDPQSNAVALKIPTNTNTSDEICLLSKANCVGTGGGASTTAGSPNYIAKYNTSSQITSSQLYDNGTNVYVGATSGGGKFNVGATNQFQVSSTGAVTAIGVDAGNGLLQGIAGLTILGNTNINASGSGLTNIAAGSGTGAVAIGNNTGNTAITIDSGTSAINIGTGGQARAVNLATGGAAQTLIAGSLNTTSTTTIQGGTGAGAITLTPGTTGTIVVGAAAGTGSITLGNSSAAQTVIVGGGTGQSSVQIANDGTSGNTVTIAGGATATTKTDTVNIATGNTAGTGNKVVHIADGSPAGTGTNTVTIGSLVNASTTTIQGGIGAGGVTLRAGGGTGTGIIATTLANSSAAFQVQNAGGSGALIVDTTPINAIVTNPSFETGTTGWTGIGTTTFAQSTSIYYAGLASLQVVTDGVTSGAGAKYVTGNAGSALSNGTTYTISWYARNNGASFTDMIASYSANGTVGGEASCVNINTQTVVTTGWTRYSCQVTPGAGPVAGSYINIKQVGATAHTFFIDAVQVEAGTVANSFRETSLIVSSRVSSSLNLQNAQDSTTAFSVQNASGTALINADTLNMKATITGNSANTALTVNNSSTGKSIDVQSAGTSVFAISNTAGSEGSALFKPKTDNSAAFQVQNAAGGTILNVDSTGGNLVKNGSFEVNATDWTTVSRTGGTGSPGSFYGGFPASVASGGSNYVATANLSGNLATTTQYTLSFYAQTTGGSSYTPTLTAAFGGTTCSATSPTQNVWTRYSCTVTTGAGTYNTVTFTNNLPDQGFCFLFCSPQTIIDGVRLEAGATATTYKDYSLTANGSFTSPLSVAHNSTTAFNIQNNTASTLFNADTSNMNVTVRGDTLSSGNALTVSSTSSTHASGSLANVSQNGLFTTPIITNTNLLNLSRSNTAGGAANPTVTLDSRNNGTNSSGTSSVNVSYTHVIGSFTNRALTVSVGVNNNGSAPSCTATYGGVPMQALVSAPITSANYYSTYVFGMASPPVGSASVSVTCTGAGTLGAAAASTSWYNVDVSNGYLSAFPTVSSNTSASASTLSLTLNPTTTRDKIVDSFYSSGCTPYSVGAGQTQYGGFNQASHKDGATTSTGVTFNTTGACTLTYSGAVVKAAPTTATEFDGAVATFSSNCTVNAGAACIDTGNILNLNQQYASASGNALNVQNAGTGAGINIQNSGTGLAFRVQNGSASNLLTADTTNMRVIVGSSGTATGQFFVGGKIPTTNLGSVSAAFSYAIEAQGNFVYATNLSGNTLTSYDVTNPASPVATGSSYSTSSTPRGLSVRGKYAYIVTNSGNKLEIVNISNPYSLTGVSTLNLSTTNAMGVYVQGRYAYITDSGSAKLQIVDISNPANPVSVNVFTTTGAATGNKNVYVQGRYVYYLTSTQFQIIDVSNPSAPVSTSIRNTGGLALAVQGRYAYMLNNGTTFSIFDISNPASTSAAIYSGAITASFGFDLVVQGNYAYVLGTVINILDVSTPASPVNLGSLSAGSQASLAIQGRYLYAGGTANLLSYDLGGTYSQSLEVGALQTGTMSVRNNIDINNDAQIKGGLTVGGFVNMQSNMAVSGQVLFSNTSNSATAFQVQNATGKSLLSADTTLSTVGINTNNNVGLNSWTANSATQDDKKINAASVAYNGYIYNMGGYHTVAFLSTRMATTEYVKVNADGTLGTWTVGTTMNSARELAGAVAYNGYMYMIGGSNGSGSYNTYEYAKIKSDGSLDTWVAGANNLNTARRGNAAFVANGYIYTLGGYDGGSYLTSVESAKINQDGSLGTWTALGATPMGTARYSFPVAVANGYVYALGTSSNSAGASVERAAINTGGTLGAWTSSGVSAMGTARINHSATVANGTIYVLGGSGSGTTEYAKVNSDGTISSWSATTSMASHDSGHSTVLVNGNVYAIGGTSSGGNTTGLIEYATLSKLKVGGSVDLVGVGGYDLVDGQSGTGGELTAGNTNIVGTLNVQGDALLRRRFTLWNSLDSTNAFQVQNANGVTLLGVDTANSRIYSGIADGGSAIGFTLTTSSAYTTAGAKLLSVQNNATEKFFIDKDGNVGVISGSALAFQGSGNTQNVISKKFICTAATSAGDLVIIDTANPGQLTTTTTANSALVAGIVRTGAGAGGTCEVAITGIIQINVDTLAVNVGDMIASSGTAGRGTANNAPGAGQIVGKALSSKSGGSNGTVWILITQN